MAFLAILPLNFHSGVHTTIMSCFKQYSPCKIWEKPIDNTSFFTFSNCLVYQKGYRPKFYNWLPVFLEKEQTTSTNQNFIICCQYFSCHCFVSLWYFSHMFLPYLSSDGLIFFCFLLRVGPWGCCCVLNLKSTRRVTHFLNWWGIAISLTCISLP